MVIRRASRPDLPAIMALLRHEDEVVDLAGIEIGARLEESFHAIDADARNEMLVLEADGEVVGYLQITYIPGLGRGGGERAVLEGIRIRVDRRGGGLGRALVREAITRAQARGCVLVQLSSNLRRRDAHRFYESLGFELTHQGFKLAL